MKRYFIGAAMLFAFCLITLPSALTFKAAAVSERPRKGLASRDGFKPAGQPQTFVVNTTEDSSDEVVGDGNCADFGGDCSLRAAIEEANANEGTTVINFSIPPGGPQTINVAEPLPDILSTMLIDATTQPGFNGTPIIVLNSVIVEAIVDGFVLAADNSRIRGFVITNFAGNGITVFGDENSITDNFIGVGLDGVTPAGNGGAGVQIGRVPVIDQASAADFSPAVFDANTVSDNRIAFNRFGVVVIASENNRISANSIFSNAELGIDLNADGVTPNDFCDEDQGANDQQNFPILTSVQADANNISIAGTLDSPPNSSFQVEFFSNSECDPSGNGEGQTFIGVATVMSGKGCGASFAVTFPVTIPGGSFITATATDQVGNTSEFSPCILVAQTNCTITCPPDQAIAVQGNACGTLVSYSPPTVSEGCPEVAVTCTPPSGSFFPVGATQVICQLGTGPICAFNVSVLESSPPSIVCPADLLVTTDGQRPRVVNFPDPQAADNCTGQVQVLCVPPSGSTFPPGTTLINCTAVDASGNTASCRFNVTVADSTPPTITCPPNVNMQAPSGQCSAVVNFPAPGLGSSPPGTLVICAPASGATFPAGITMVTCTATTPAGQTARCSFAVTVNGQPQLSVIPPGPLEFGVADPPRKPRNNTPQGCDCTKTFVLQNTGCATVEASLTAIMRTGAETTNGRITDTDDSDFFSVVIVNADGSERPAECTVGVNCIRINTGGQITFRVRFRPFIPRLAGRTDGLSASHVLCDTITSKLVFAISGGQQLTVDLVGRVTDEVKMVNPDNTRKRAKVKTSRSSGQVEVTYAVFDSDLNVRRARYVFRGRNGNQIGEALEVDLAPSIDESDIIKGQSFLVIQRFDGDFSGVASVEVTVFDDESSDSTTGALRAGAGASGGRLTPSRAISPRSIEVTAARPLR